MNPTTLSKNCPISPTGSFRSQGLTRRFLLALGTLVLTGSVALLAVLQWLEKRQEEQAFLHQARTNANFIGHISMSLSDVLAGHLGTLTGWKIYFREGKRSWIGAPTSPALQVKNDTGVVQSLADGSFAVVLPIQSPVRGEWGQVAFVRPPEAPGATLARPAALAALGAFMLVALAVAYWLARSLIRPLRSFAAALPQIGSDAEPESPGADRNDELGHVARTFLATREQLREERAKREQAERLATLGRMAASLAHEVRNPVSAIRMHAELMEEDVAEKIPDAVESLAHIKRESDKIESLVQQWTFFAKPEPPKTQRGDLRGIVQQVASLLAPAAARARLKLSVNVPYSPVVADFDATRLSQALTNVLQNAIHASAEGGGVSLDVQAGDGVATISISDSGPGFSSLALEKFAEPFFSEKEGGMGLGLTVTSELCAAHGGSLQVENRAERGAVVTLKLPTLQH